ncbi:MAG: hypothetical protein ACWGP1_11825 [Syntrophobacteria bacterium]|jgi:hypothetical protein
MSLGPGADFGLKWREDVRVTAKQRSYEQENQEKEWRPRFP